MYLASAYPNSQLSGLTVVIIALVMAASLGAWLGLVFLADRQPRDRRHAANVTEIERGTREAPQTGEQHKPAA